MMTDLSFRDLVLDYLKKSDEILLSSMVQGTSNLLCLTRKKDKIWFGILFTGDRQALGFPGRGKIDILSLRLPPEEVKEAIQDKRILPAIQMNATNWIHLPLDGSLSFAEIQAFLAKEVKPIEEKKSKVVFTSGYQEEKIPARPNRVLNSWENQKIQAMHQIGLGKSKDDPYVFYQEALFMKDFIAECDHPVDFHWYYPTYERMTYQQLLTYFYFRKYLRNRQPTPYFSLSYLYVYIYEILMNIGYSKAAGKEELEYLYQAYGKEDKGLANHLKQWIQDYQIFYHLKGSYIWQDADETLYAVKMLEEEGFQKDKEKEQIERLYTLMKATHLELIDLDYSRFSTKNLKEKSDDVKRIALRLFFAFSQYFKTKPIGSLFHAIYGKSSQYPYYMFSMAVFYNYQKKDKFSYPINPLVKICYDKQWTRETDFSYPYNDTNLILNSIHEISRLIRKHYHLSGNIKPTPTVPYLSAIVEETLNAYDKEKEEESRPKITIDLSSLNQIREDAIHTQNALLTEEEKEIEEEPKIETPIPLKEENVSPDDEVLNPDEIHFLKAILYHLPYQDYMKEHHLKPSLLMESINNKLMDSIGDTVLEDDGSEIQVIEDYQEELMSHYPNRKE